MELALQLAKQSTIPAEVAAVRDRVARWRGSRVKRSAMPEELWEAAVSLVPDHGLYRVARVVRVDYGALKDRCSRASSGEPGAIASGVFVEVEASQLLAPPAEPAAATGAVVELFRPDGARLVVRLPAHQAVDLVVLAGAFCGAGR